VLSVLLLFEGKKHETASAPTQSSVSYPILSCPRNKSK
jgi:hypothetical protein